MRGSELLCAASRTCPTLPAGPSSSSTVAVWIESTMAMRGFVEAIYYMKTHRKESLTILAKYLKTDDADALEEAYESIVQALIPEKPYPTLKGIDIILRELGVKDPNARSAKPEQFVDLTFIKELDSSGFIDRLYKSSAVAKAAPSRAEPVPVPEIAKAVRAIKAE